MFVIAALAAAVLFAVSTVLKHRSAVAIGPLGPGGPTGSSTAGHLIGVVTRTVRHPAWLAGIGVDAGALTLQIVALHLGPIATVQPLLAVSLVVALLIDRRRVPRGVWIWAVALVAALAGFVVLTGTATTNAPPDSAPTLVAVLVVAVVVLGCLAGVRRLGSGRLAATTLGVGVGIAYAASAALLKVLGDHAVRHGVAGVLVSWQLVALIACGAAGVLLNQLAFSAGPLRLSLPTIAAVDPVVSVVLGVAVFDERVRLSSGYGAAQLVALLVVVVAIVKIGRVQAARQSATDVPDPVSAR